MRNIFSALLAASLITLLGTAMAKKAPEGMTLAMKSGDGQTPAEETVCDGLCGKAFGLCNAYCEAKDCDSDTPNGSAKSCEILYDKFEAETGSPPPCEPQPAACPCTTLPGFEAMTTGAVYGCTDFGDGVLVNNPWGVGAAGVILGADPGCMVIGYDGTYATMSTTSEEAQMCAQMLIDNAQEQGVSCTI